MPGSLGIIARNVVITRAQYDQPFSLRSRLESQVVTVYPTDWNCLFQPVTAKSVENVHSGGQLHYLDPIGGQPDATYRCNNNAQR